MGSGAQLLPPAGASARARVSHHTPGLLRDSWCEDGWGRGEKAQGGSNKSIFSQLLIWPQSRFLREINSDGSLSISPIIPSQSLPDLAPRSLQKFSPFPILRISLVVIPPMNGCSLPAGAAPRPARPSSWAPRGCGWPVRLWRRAFPLAFPFLFCMFVCVRA